MRSAVAFGEARIVVQEADGVERFAVLDEPFDGKVVGRAESGIPWTLVEAYGRKFRADFFGGPVGARVVGDGNDEMLRIANLCREVAEAVPGQLPAVKGDKDDCRSFAHDFFQIFFASGSPMVVKRTFFNIADGATLSNRMFRWVKIQGSSLGRNPLL